MSSRLLNDKQSFDSYRWIYSWLAISLALCAIVISGKAMSVSEAKGLNGEPVEEKVKEKGIKHLTKTAARKTATGTKIAAKKTAAGTVIAAKKTASGTKIAAVKTKQTMSKVIHPNGGKQKQRQSQSSALR